MRLPVNYGTHTVVWTDTKIHIIRFGFYLWSDCSDSIDKRSTFPACGHQMAASGSDVDRGRMKATGAQ